MKHPKDDPRFLEILGKAWGLGPSELEALLEKTCGQDNGMRDAVRAAIGADQADPDYLEDVTPILKEAILEIDQDLNPPRREMRPGQQFGRYEIIELIGEGGMGEVYKALDPQLDRPVALKLLHASSTSTWQGLLTEEARLGAKFQAPNIVRILDIGEEGEIVFLVMEYLEGENLRQSVGRLGLLEALEVAIGVAGALRVASKERIVHRDIKPENIFRCSDGSIKVLDFGLAKLREHQAEPQGFVAMAVDDRKSVPLVGTPKYMSPEQVLRESLDERSDIFGLGIVLFEMVTGHRPFDRPTDWETFDAIVRDDPPQLSLYLEKVPDDLQHIVNKALRKGKGERYQTAQDLINDLEVCKKNAKELATTVILDGSKKALPQTPRTPEPQLSIIDPATRERRLPPIPIPAVIHAAQTFNPLPVDLGAVCALDRSRFIVVIAGSDDDGVFDNLVRVERGLRHVLSRKTGLPFSLSKRIWIRIELANSPGAPDDIAELALNAGYPNNLSDADFSSAVPGIFLEWRCSGREQKDTLMASAKAWCEALIERIFSRTQLGVVLHIAAHSAEAAEELARRVSGKLILGRSQLPLTIFFISNRKQRPPTPDTDEVDVDSFGVTPSAAPGSYFRTWLKQILKNGADRQRLREEAENYSEVIDLYNALMPSSLPDRQDIAAYAPMTVFLSSTAQDLVDYRQVADDTILRLSRRAVVMERFGPLPGEPTAECERKARESDVVVCIVAHRYGFVPEKGRGSITRREVEAANAAGKDVLVWIVADDHPWSDKKEQDLLTDQAVLADPSRVEEVVENVKALGDFKTWLRTTFVCDTFTTPDELGRNIAIALSAYSEKRAPLSADAQKKGEIRRVHALQPSPHFCDAADLVADLSRLPSLSLEFHRQFLGLVDSYLPEHIEELLRAYVGYRRGSAAREALAFAVKKGYQDKLWANEADVNRFFQSDDKSAEADALKSVDFLDAHADVTGSIADRFAHLLLLHYGKYGNKAAAHHIAELLDADSLSGPYRAVGELFLGRTDLQTFISSYGKEAYRIALAAGYEFNISLRELQEWLSIDNSDLWALVGALPTSESRVAELLEMKPACRAIMGLSTPEEWGAIKQDARLLEKILSARQQRPLDFEG